MDRKYLLLVDPNYVGPQMLDLLYEAEINGRLPITVLLMVNPDRALKVYEVN